MSMMNETWVLNWDKALQHLNLSLKEYENEPDCTTLLLALKRRFSAGERSQGLFDELMEFEL